MIEDRTKGENRRTFLVHYAQDELLPEERELQAFLRDAHRKGHSFRYLGSIYGVSFGVVQRILEGKFPKRDTIRERLGLPKLVRAYIKMKPPAKKRKGISGYQKLKRENERLQKKVELLRRALSASLRDQHGKEVLRSPR